MATPVIGKWVKLTILNKVVQIVGLLHDLRDDGHDPILINCQDKFISFGYPDPVKYNGHDFELYNIPNYNSYNKNHLYELCFCLANLSKKPKLTCCEIV